MKRPELLAPAGSMEGVRAAVQSGASAVYLGFGTFNARRGAKNFTQDEMAAALAYCRARGVKTNVTLNVLIGDREKEAALRDARFLYEAGADALIVQDLGLARALRRCAPSLALHASTQMTICTLDGARTAKELGFSRVVLARETPLREIRRIVEKSGVEIEIFVHGALCRCYSGQCWLSAVIGRRSGNRGLCAQPCRLPYRYDGEGKERWPLSLKDLSLAEHIPEICEAGVASLKIEGRMKRPEYTAVVTKVYADLLREQRRPTAEEADALRRVFSRDGFTDGYFTGEQGDGMLGTKTELPLHEVQPLYDEAARRFAEGKEAPLVPVDLHLWMEEGKPLRLTATDGAHTAQAAGPEPERSRRIPAPDDTQRFHKALHKTGGTPFSVALTKMTVDDWMTAPVSAVNALRREALADLLKQREAPPVRAPWREDDEAASLGEASVMADETGILLHYWDSLFDGVTVFDTEPIAPAPARPGESLGKDETRRWLAESFEVPRERTYVRLSKGISVPTARLDALREEALARFAAQPRLWRGFTVEARTFGQAEAAAEVLNPKTVYLPLTVLAEDRERCSELARRFRVAAVLPRVFFDAEREELFGLLLRARRDGVHAALAGNLGQLELARQCGVAVYGDFGLNAFNTDTLSALADLGVRRQTLSFELRLEQIRALRAPLETELIVYGRLPLMVFELCAIRGKSGKCSCKEGVTSLTDRTGRSFPLLPEYGCRNTLLNSVPLAIPTMGTAGTDFARLRFTTESPVECCRIARAYADGELAEVPGGTTRGLYRRGVE